MDLYKEFQYELTGNCEFNSIKEDNILFEYDVREDISIGDDGYKRRMIYKVSFAKDECDVKCSCLKFEFKGVLCRHRIAVLIRNDVKLLPEKYILRRWRKYVRRSHTRINVYHDGWNITHEQVRFDKLCNAFAKAADLAADDEENFTSVMDLLDNIKKELSSKQKDKNDKPSLRSTILMSSGNNNILNKNQITILDPIPIRGKGRSPSVMKKYDLFKKRKSKDINNLVDDDIEDAQTIGMTQDINDVVKKKRQRKKKSD